RDMMLTSMPLLIVILSVLGKILTPRATTIPAPRIIRLLPNERLMGLGKIRPLGKPADRDATARKTSPTTKIKRVVSISPPDTGLAKKVARFEMSHPAESSETMARFSSPTVIKAPWVSLVLATYQPMMTAATPRAAISDATG